MSKVTETLVLDCANQDAELLSDGLALHFQNHDRWFWRDIAAEGLRVHNLMFPENEQHSALEALLLSVAAAAADGVFAAIAAAIGVKSADVECALSRWYDGQDTATPSIGLERLRQMLPQQSEPSWEHVVLGRLCHERIVHCFQDASGTANAASEPDIDGLDPSDITRGETGWIWRQPTGASQVEEFENATGAVGAAIARAGYRVTGHGFDATHEWLNFDLAAPTLDPLDAYQKESCATQLE